jgi:AraC family transcriptional regulator, regulatory protein of adaptative response / methylated-DNA-[protein]-cysteine methyltransferase
MNTAATAKFTTDDQRWEAVSHRDRLADGCFFYAVKTTGVYCRPTCSSRLPKRVNVRFFLTCGDAERAGYRACKKCGPKASGPTPIPDAVVRACRMIEEADEPPSLNDLAGAVGLSPFYFHRLFKSVVGVTPKSYADARRMLRFQDGLLEGRPITRAIYDAGFGSSSRCYEGAADNLGMTPSAYRNGGTGQVIRYAVAQCHLGWVLVAATDRGICGIEFGGTAAALRSAFKARFPAAVLRGDDADFAAWVAEVLALIEAPDRRFDLPLDIQGTAFQRRVWEALRAIPAGSTATYADIAARIGSPSAVRAVARACAANPVAVVVPCHRVVGTDGQLKGYRWGVQRKRALLDREADARARS